MGTTVGVRVAVIAGVGLIIRPKVCEACTGGDGTIGDGDDGSGGQISQSGDIQADGRSLRSRVLAGVDGVAGRGVVVECGRLPQSEPAKGEDAGNLGNKRDRKPTGGDHGRTGARTGGLLYLNPRVGRRQSVD